jgi:hypothetical protein
MRANRRPVRTSAHLRFAVKARKVLVVSDQSVWPDLDRHVTPQVGIAGAVHLTHSPGHE